MIRFMCLIQSVFVSCVWFTLLSSVTCWLFRFVSLSLYFRCVGLFLGLALPPVCVCSILHDFWLVEFTALKLFCFKLKQFYFFKQVKRSLLTLGCNYLQTWQNAIWTELWSYFGYQLIKKTSKLKHRKCFCHVVRIMMFVRDVLRAICSSYLMLEEVVTDG